MKHFFKNDLTQIFRDKDPRPRIEEGSDCKLLIEIINDAYIQTDDRKQKRILLERGIELTGMGPENLSERALELGYRDLAQDYRSYVNPSNISTLSQNLSQS